MTKNIFVQFDLNKNGYLGPGEFSTFWNVESGSTKASIVTAVYDRARNGEALGVSPINLDVLFGTQTAAQKELTALFKELRDLTVCHPSSG